MQLLQRLTQIKTPRDLSLANQLFLRSLATGVEGFSMNDVKNIGRTANVLIKYLTTVFPDPYGVSDLTSKLIEVFSPVFLKLSQNERLQLLPFLPSQVALRLVEKNDVSNEVIYEVAGKVMMEELRNAATERVKAARTAQTTSSQDRSQEGAEMYHRVMNEKRLYEISEETFKEMTRIMKDDIDPVIQKIDHSLKDEVAKLDHQLNEAIAYRKAINGPDPSISPDQIKEWIGEFQLSSQSWVELPAEMKKISKQEINSAKTPLEKIEKAPPSDKHINGKGDQRTRPYIKQIIPQIPDKAPTITVPEYEVVKEEQTFIEQSPFNVDEPKSHQDLEEHEVNIVPNAHYDQSHVVSELRSRHKQGASI